MATAIRNQVREFTGYADALREVNRLQEQNSELVKNLGAALTESGSSTTVLQQALADIERLTPKVQELEADMSDALRRGIFIPEGHDLFGLNRMREELEQAQAIVAGFQRQNRLRQITDQAEQTIQEVRDAREISLLRQQFDNERMARSARAQEEAARRQFDFEQRLAEQLEESRRQIESASIDRARSERFRQIQRQAEDERKAREEAGRRAAETIERVTRNALDRAQDAFNLEAVAKDVRIAAQSLQVVSRQRRARG